ncbi:MAG TPA: response regulator [Kofleriaceae bacterium]|jgi:DNA-binding response OmpR family regulator
MRQRDPRAVATYKVEFDRLGRRIVASTEDVSRRGLFVRTVEFLPAGEVVELFIYLDAQLPVRMVSRVVHVLSRDGARALGREPGMGFEFLEHDPARLEALRSHLAQHIRSASASLERVTVSMRLVVADASVKLLERVSHALGEVGFEVATAEDGGAAYQACLAQIPDVLLTADYLPVMDGWTLMRRFRAHPMLADVPIVLMSDQTGDLTRLSAYRMGARDFIQRPFTDEELALRLKAVASQSKRTAEQVILRGRIAEVGLGTLLSMLDFERKSGLLLLISQGAIVTLFIAEGRVVKIDPVPEGRTPRERMIDILDWAEGRFEFLMSDVVGRDEIEFSTPQLLLEHARQKDDGER